MTPEQKYERAVECLHAIAGWGAAIDDEPESRQAARVTLRTLGLVPDGYRVETSREWRARRRRMARTITG